MTTAEDIAARFARETADHQMTVMHDRGLYRHLRFRPVPPDGKPRHSMYWFDLITVPGTLIFQGDGTSFVFRRITDMFEFFRGPVGRVNPQYWAEKLTSDRDSVMVYDQESFEQQVKEAFVDAARGEGVPAGTGRALREDVLDQDIMDERVAREALEAFEHEGFRFYDTWEWNFREYDWWFLWALHAIVWGIAYHDSGTRPALPAPKVSTPSLPKASAPDAPLLEPKRRAVVDVHLPEPVGGVS